MSTGITLPSSNVALTSISFASADLELITEQLQKKQAEAPALFNGFPCVIDLQKFSPEEFDLTEVINICQQYGFLAVAVHNVADTWQRCVQQQDRKSTRLNSSHVRISYAVFCLKKKKSTAPESVCQRENTSPKPS